MGPKRNKGKGQKGKKKAEAKEQELIQSGPVYERWLTDQMRQLAKMESSTQRANYENKALRIEILRIDENRRDIVAYLRRLLGEKCEEAQGLTEINKALESEITAETAKFDDEMNLKSQRSSEAIDRLLAEIEGLNGRLNNLSEYKDQRDVLLDKTNKLGTYLEIMLVRGELIERQYEKGNSILKENMRKEMDYNLQILSSKIQRAARDQIAVATQRVIKENVALNNELSLLIASWQKLHDENEQIRDDNRHYENKLELERAMRESLMKKNEAQDEMIERLTLEHLRIDEIHKETDLSRRIADNLETKINLEETSTFTARDRIAFVKNELVDQQGLVSRLTDELKKLERINALNSNLIQKVRDEVGDVRRGLVNIQGRGSIPPDELLRIYEVTFNRLFELFEEDWLLDWSGEALKSLSLQTVIGVLP